MTHGSLFSGIGGFDLAAEWMGWENVFHCEWNEFGQKVLKYYWPNAESFNDITKTDFTHYANRIDILTGGFPCQPYSLAGKRKGKEDERHLWPEMLRAIREIQPRWVVGENVFGLINWSGGCVVHKVTAHVEASGYEGFMDVLPACAVNATHRRDRVWFVAHRASSRDFRKGHNATSGEWCNEGIGGSFFYEYNNNGTQRVTSNPHSNGQHRCNSQHEINTSEGREYAQRDFEQVVGNAADTNRQRVKERNIPGITGEKTFISRRINENGNYWQNFPTQPPICTGNDGVPANLDGITFSKWRNESIKAAGNAIVPQVALQIFKSIEQYENLVS